VSLSAGHQAAAEHHGIDTVRHHECKDTMESFNPTCPELAVKLCPVTDGRQRHLMRRSCKYTHILL